MYIWLWIFVQSCADLYVTSIAGYIDPRMNNEPLAFNANKGKPPMAMDAPMDSKRKHNMGRIYFLYYKTFMYVTVQCWLYVIVYVIEVTL